MIAIDYGFLDDAGEVEKDGSEKARITFLAVKDRNDKAVAALPVPCKGAGNGYPVKRLRKQLDTWGRTRVVLRSDQEPAILDLKRQLKESRLEETVLEEAPRGDHRSNGEAESTVALLARQFRIVRAALEDRVGKIPIDKPILRWLLEYQGNVITRFRIGEDGLTSYKKLKGRDFKEELVEFGEKVMFRVHRKANEDGGGERQAKAEPRFEEGVFIDISDSSHEKMIGTRSGGVVKTSTIKRLPKEDRWSRENVLNISGLPWDWKSDEEQPDENRTGVIPAEQPVPVDEDNFRYRNTRLTKDRLVRFGYTEGCRGCRAARTSRPPLPHSQECRSRIEEAIIAEGGEEAVRSNPCAEQPWVDRVSF